MFSGPKHKTVLEQLLAELDNDGKQCFARQLAVKREMEAAVLKSSGCGEIEGSGSDGDGMEAIGTIMDAMFTDAFNSIKEKD